jgi:hypothetical protein
MFLLRRSPRKRLSPHVAHRFIEPEETRSGLAVSAVQPDFQMVSQMAVANSSLRAAHCGLAGCGKPREDPIHWPADE